MNKPERFLLAAMAFAELWKRRQELIKGAPPRCECVPHLDFDGEPYWTSCFYGRDDVEKSLDTLCDVGERRREIYLELIGLAKLISAARRKMRRAYR